MKSYRSNDKMPVVKIVWYEPLGGSYALSTYRAAYPVEYRSRITHIVSRSYQLNAYETKINCSSGRLTFENDTVVCDSDECISCCARSTDGPKKINIPVPLILKGSLRIYILSHHFMDPEVHKKRFLKLLSVLDSIKTETYIIDEGGDEGTYFSVFSEDNEAVAKVLRENGIKYEEMAVEARV